MRIALLVFPTLYNTHDNASAASSLGQRLEPSVLSLASLSPEDTNEFILDNLPREGVDLYLCSIYTRGWAEFKDFAKKVGRDKVIAGGYHPTARPEEVLQYAHKVVTGLCGNIEQIIHTSPAGILKGVHQPRLLQRQLINMRDMAQVYPDVRPNSMVGSSISSIGCPYDCEFCATPKMSGHTLRAYPLDIVAQDIQQLQKYDTKVVFIRDESFATHPAFNDVVPLYGQAEFDVLYSFGTAAALTEQKVKLLAKNNWHSLCLGLEDVSKTYRKNKTLQAACDLCRDHNVGVTLSFIVDDADKDIDAIRLNYQRLTQAFFDLKPIMVCANFLMPLPGTVLGDRMSHRVTPELWSKYDSKTPLFSSPELAQLHRRLAVAVQALWYRSDEYQQLRKFDCGDTLHQRMIELENAFGLNAGIPSDLMSFLR